MDKHSTSFDILVANIDILVYECGSMSAAAKKGGLNSKAQLSHWKTGYRIPRPATRRKFEQTYGLATGWLDTDHSNENQSKALEENVINVTKHKVPVISWVAAGAWADIEDLYNVGEADYWLDVGSGNRLGKNAFALEVRGDSMTSNALRQSFPAGGHIVCDPDKNWSVSDFVIVKNVETQTSVFKQVVGEPDNYWLRSLNEDKNIYPDIRMDSSNFRVVGRVMEYHSKIISL